VTTELQCPTCGAGQQLHNPGVVVIVCAYCQTTLYREDAALRAGRKSVVAVPRSGIRVGVAGKLLGVRVTVIGRVQFAHERGHWDEWMLESSDGDEVWLVEDEGGYSLESPYDRKLPAGTHFTPAGGTITLDDKTYSVRETGSATCSGGEGQLPRDFTPDERIRYVDAASSNGQELFTMEVGEKGDVSAWTGRPIPRDAVEFADDDAPHSGPAEAARAISCPKCGGQVGWPDGSERPKTLSCTHCTAVLNLTEAHPAFIGERNVAIAKRFDLKIGDSGTIRGAQSEVIGRLHYTEYDSEPTSEYLLWSATAGYRWLANYAGNWTLSRPTGMGPAWNDLRGIKPKDKVVVADMALQFFEAGRLELKYVDGALPWEARIGDTTNYRTFIGGTRGLTLEKSGNEVESFVAEHIDGLKVLSAFGRGNLYFPPTEIGALRPNPLDRWKLPIVAALVLLALGNLFSAHLAYRPGTTLTTVNILASAGEEANLSEPFTIPKGTEILGLHVRAAVNNGWVYITGELLDESGSSVLAVTGSEVSYYHGTEGGESWSEGSTSERVLLKAPQPGRYRFSASREGSQTPTVQIAITRGDRLVRYPLGAGLLLLLYPSWALARSAGFERRRWGLNEED